VVKVLENFKSQIQNPIYLVVFPLVLQWKVSNKLKGERAEKSVASWSLESSSIFKLMGLEDI